MKSRGVAIAVRIDWFPPPDIHGHGRMQRCDGCDARFEAGTVVSGAGPPGLSNPAAVTGGASLDDR